MSPSVIRWRSLDYYVLRVCERFGMKESDFDTLSYPDQLRLLAYDRVRREDEEKNTTRL